MLSKSLLSLLLFGYGVFGQTTTEMSTTQVDDSTTEAFITSTVVSQYAIGLFNGGEFPFALDVCQPTDVFGSNGYQKFSCMDTNTLQKDTYLASDSTCTGTVQETNYYNNTKTGTGSLYDFNCDSDAVNAYTKVQFSLVSCDNEEKYTATAAINACTYASDDYYYFVVQCDGTEAQLQYYAVAGCTVGVGNFAVLKATDTCGFFIQSLGQNVYASVLDCNDGSEEGDSSSGVQTFGIVGLVLSSLIAYLKM